MTKEYTVLEDWLEITIGILGNMGVDLDLGAGVVRCLGNF